MRAAALVAVAALAAPPAAAAAPAPVSAGAARAQLPSGRTSYRSPADYAADLRAMVRAHPRLARLVTIGTSVQGRPLEGVEIARRVHRGPDGRPTHVEFGMHHANEWSSGEVVVEYGLDLLRRYGHRRRVTRLVDRERTFLFPLVNPDGYAIARSSDPRHRKNAREVDLNRNYGAFWGGPGSSDSVAESFYRGPAPFSEPETRAVRDWSTSHQVIVVNSNHNYGGQVLYQPGFSRVDEPGLPAGTELPGGRAFRRVARRMAGAAGYEAKPAYRLYDVTGATEDFNYFAQGAFGFTTEIGYDDHQPPYREGVIDQYDPGLRQAFLRAGEAALSRASHGVIAGTAPAGRTLTLSRDLTLSTAYVITQTEGPAPFTGPASTFPVHLESTLRVGPSGRYRWAVNPSTSPLTRLEGRSTAWTLRCGAETRDVTVGLGQRRRVDLTCA